MNGKQRRGKTVMRLAAFLTGLFVFGMFSACSSTPKSIPDADSPNNSLKKPLNIGSENHTWTIIWDRVAHASGYKVSLDEKEYTTDTNALDIYYLASPGESLRVKVKALGDGKKYGDSKWSEETIYETEAMSVDLPSYSVNDTVNPPTNFEYALLQDGTYCISLPSTVDLAKVERLVFPDYYNGKLITAVGNKTCEKGRFLGSLSKTALKSIRLPSGLREIGDSCFKCLIKLNHIRIPKGVTKIGLNSFYDLPALTDLEFPQSGMEYMGGYNFFGSPWEKEYVSKQPDGCITFGKALWQHKGELPEEWAFEDLPEEVTMIGGGAFQEKNTQNECSVTVPQRIEKIGPAAFSQWENLRFIDLSATKLETIEEQTFYNDTNLSGALLPDGLKEIGKYAFFVCSSLEEIDLPDGLKVIGDSAFTGCSSLEGIDLPDGLEEIGANAFYRCSSLEEIVLPNGLKKIGSSAFGQCNSLTEISFPGSVIFGGGNFPMVECANLKKVIFEEGIEEITGSMYGVNYGANNIEEFIFPSTIRDIGQLFCYSCLSTIVVPDGVVKLERAFQSCENLVSVVIPKSVKEIDGRVLFERSENVQNIFYCGSEEEWDQIEFYDLQEKYPDIDWQWILMGSKPSPQGTLEGRTVYFYSQDQPSQAGNYWHYDASHAPVAW